MIDDIPCEFEPPGALRARARESSARSYRCLEGASVVSGSHRALRVGTVCYRQAGCWQSHRSSILSPACLQCSLQYFPCGPCGSTMHSQEGCAHFAADAAIG